MSFSERSVIRGDEMTNSARASVNRDPFIVQIRERYSHLPGAADAEKGQVTDRSERSEAVDTASSIGDANGADRQHRHVSLSKSQQSQVQMAFSSPSGVGPRLKQMMKTMPSVSEDEAKETPPAAVRSVGDALPAPAADGSPVVVSRTTSIFADGETRAIAPPALFSGSPVHKPQGLSQERLATAVPALATPPDSQTQLQQQSPTQPASATSPRVAVPPLPLASLSPRSAALAAAAEADEKKSKAEAPAQTAAAASVRAS